MAEVLTHKCPNCDGPLTFDPEDQKFHCPFCLSIFTEEEVTNFEEKQEEARTINEAVIEQEKENEKAAMDLFVCPNCGAEIVTDATTAATYCYFCHNPVVLSGRLSGEFLPNKLVPFAIGKEAATSTFLEWVKKKKFIPNDFFNSEQIEKLTGVYFPYWTIKAMANGELSGLGTSLRVWRVGDIEYTETKQFDVTRKGHLIFKNLVKNALSKNTQQKMVESVQPFPLDKAIDFRSQYLAGFQAEKRDIAYADIKAEVDTEFSGYSEELLRNSINGYTSFQKKHQHISIDKVENAYMLLPVWLVTYRKSSDKVFYYAMNGQTGKTSGVLPISYKKLGLTCLGIFIFLAIVFMIGGYFL
ncbi:MAG TPA: TFIIB-type zinc ribbon-containing protein [Candidatus Tetragenococcus pullicola]|nr:TFIIB-type zinc ribbon-containing protein [Candidatus Tetragenococcus pullicola]